MVWWLYCRYAMCVNKSNGTTSLYKISKGKRLAETPVVTTFNYEIRSAAMTVASSHPSDKSIVLVAYDAIGDVVRIYTIQVSTDSARQRDSTFKRFPNVATIGMQPSELTPIMK